MNPSINSVGINVKSVLPAPSDHLDLLNSKLLGVLHNNRLLSSDNNIFFEIHRDVLVHFSNSSLHPAR
jgi:hypothetical protein